MEITHAEQTAVSAAMPPAERAALALNSSQTERDLLVLATKHASIQVIKDKAGRDQAHGAAMEVKRARTTIERTGKEARDDATKFSKAVIAEQNRLVAIIEAEEQRLLALRDAWDAEQEKIREAAAAAERFRIEQIMGRIDAIKGFERMARDCRTSGAVQRPQEAMSKIDMTGLQEFEDRAQHTLSEVTEAVQQILTQRQADEAERARIKAEQEAEAARIAQERAELERQRAEAVAAAQAAQAKAKAEADKLAAERAALEAARAEFEQRQKAHEERERAELAAREAAAWAALEAQEAEQEAVPQVNEVIDVPLIAAPAPESIGIDQPTEAATPSAAQLIQAVAEMFGVGLGEARDWLIERAADIEAAQP